MPKKTLADRTLKALRPAAVGQRYEIMDTVVPGFGVRVTDKGKRSFILIARYPGSPNPTRRTIAEYGEKTLEAARREARDWLELIRQGKDPRAEGERQRAAEQQRRANSFAAVAEDFIASKLPAERKGKEVEADIRREFLPVWQRGGGQEDSSFPSGHAAMGFYLMAPALVCYRRRPGLAAAFLLLGLAGGAVIGMARIVAGCHFPSDVLWAGGLIYFTALLLAAPFRFGLGKPVWGK